MRRNVRANPEKGWKVRQVVGNGHVCDKTSWRVRTTGINNSIQTQKIRNQSNLHVVLFLLPVGYSSSLQRSNPDFHYLAWAVSLFKWQNPNPQPPHPDRREHRSWRAEWLLQTWKVCNAPSSAVPMNKGCFPPFVPTHHHAPNLPDDY